MANGKLKITKVGNNQWKVYEQSGTGEFDLEVEDTTSGNTGNIKKPKSVKVDFSSNDQTIIVDP